MGVLKLGKMVAGMVRFFGSITGQKKLTLANVSIWPQLWTSHYCANKNIENIDGALTLAVCDVQLANNHNMCTNKKVVDETLMQLIFFINPK